MNNKEDNILAVALTIPAPSNKKKSNSNSDEKEDGGVSSLIFSIQNRGPHIFRMKSGTFFSDLPIINRKNKNNFKYANNK